MARSIVRNCSTALPPRSDETTSTGASPPLRAPRSDSAPPIGDPQRGFVRSPLPGLASLPTHSTTKSLLLCPLLLCPRPWPLPACRDAVPWFLPLING